MPNLDPTHLNSKLKIELHINVIVPITLLRIIVRKLTSPHQQFCSIKHSAQLSRILVPLVKRCQILCIKSLASIITIDLEGIVIYTNPLVGVSNGEIEIKVVLQRVVCSEIELCQWSTSGIEFKVVGANKEPEDEGGNTHKDDDSEDEFENEAENAIAKAAK